MSFAASPIMTNCFKLGQIEPNSRRCVVVGHWELCFAHPYRGMKGIQLQMIPIKANSFLNPVKDNRKIDIQIVRVRITQSRITCRNHQRFFFIWFRLCLWSLAAWWGEWVGRWWLQGRDGILSMELFRWKSKSEILFLPGTERKLHLFYFSAFPEYTHTHTYFVFYLIEIKAYFTRLSPPLHSSNKPNVTFLTHPPYIVKHKKLILCFFVSVLLPDSPPLHTISCHTYIHAYRSLLL